jgi:hypothetical protein
MQRCCSVLLQDEELRMRLAGKAQRDAEENLNWDKIAALVLDSCGKAIRRGTGDGHDR